LSASGTYLDTLTAVNGCDSIVTLNLTVLPNPTTTLNESICAGNSYTFNNQVLTTSGVYSVTLLAANGCDSVVTLNLTVNPVPIANAGENVAIEWGESTTLNGSGGSQYTWTPAFTLSNANVANPVTNNTETITYSLIVTENGCTSLPAFVTVQIIPFRIPNGFTPNGDGVNDTWEIPSIKRFPQAEIEVYNRYGQRVFKSDKGYTKQWDGKNENGEVLPFGTYYYSFNPNDGGEKRSGWITILK
jgi:gliding motility-associated-like protein